METDERDLRIAAALEEEFQSCHGLLTGALAHIEKRGSFETWEMRPVLGLMRATAQLATTISRLSGKSPPKNFENGGSIRQ